MISLRRRFAFGDRARDLAEDVRDFALDVAQPGLARVVADNFGHRLCA